MQNKPRLAVTFSVLVALVVSVACAVYVPWTMRHARHLSEQKALAQARTLDQQMSSTWDYIDSIQMQINYDAQGRYEFKHVYCAIAGKAIAHRFTDISNYSISYVRENPRSAADMPDELELTALQSFAPTQQASERAEYYRVVGSEDESTLRYVSALYYQGNCLECHGNPKGTKDRTGFLKEGKSLGDLAGAVSISIPMNLYEDDIKHNAVMSIAFFLILVLLIVTFISVAMYWLVNRPLKRVSDRAAAIGEGDWSAKSGQPETLQELDDLSSSLSNMAGQLESLYESLEEKVDQRTQELSAANEALEEQGKQLEREVAYKSQFLFIMNHELKTPAASLSAAADVWIRSVKNPSPEDRAFATEIKQQCAHLLDMIDNALGTTRIDSGGFELNVQKIDPLDLLAEAEDAIKAIALKKGQFLEHDIDCDIPFVNNDWDALAKIINNIASNAVKFTPQGGLITFIAKKDPACSQVIIGIRDTGVGLDKADQKRIFDRFVQLDSSLSRDHHGSGLGLSLARDLAHEIGVSIEIESTPGIGSLFTVSIPINWQGEREESQT